jgi:hypothetical protein
MIHFSEYLTEAADDGKLKHIHHPEDRPLMHGKKGFDHAVGALQQAHDQILQGKKNTSLTTKYDGSPAIVFGHEPKSGKFFVASKSAFNKNPKINYTPEDIEQNHGHAPGLVEKLKSALAHLPKVAPKTGVYQGDAMFDHRDVIHNPNGSASFTPNTITYTAHGQDAHKIKAAKFGIVVHQKYEGKTLAGMKATPEVDHNKFKKNPDVWHKTAEHDTGDTDFAMHHQLAFKKNMEAAKAIHDQNKNLMYKGVEPHAGEGGHLSTYINQTVRNDEKPTTRGFLNHLATKFTRIGSQYKSAAGQAKAKELARQSFEHIQTNKPHYDNLFKMHRHLQDAKNALVDTLDNGKHELEHHIENKPTKPEGYVVNYKNEPTKLVNRAEFSKANLLKVRK